MAVIKTFHTKVTLFASSLGSAAIPSGNANNLPALQYESGASQAPFIGRSFAVHLLSTTFPRYPRAEILPLGGEMASVTKPAEFSAMHIIIVMATVAGLRHDDLVIHHHLVTGIAGDLLVRSIQLEFRASIVIEIPCLPGTGVMARSAILSQSQLVYLVIVLLVAAKAVSRRIPVQLCLVAFLAVHLDVHPEQREARAAMVEFGFFPVFFGMAGFAEFPEFFLVHILFHMAGIAILLQLLRIQIAGMA